MVEATQSCVCFWGVCFYEYQIFDTTSNHFLSHIFFVYSCLCKFIIDQTFNAFLKYIIYTFLGLPQSLVETNSHKLFWRHSPSLVCKEKFVCMWGGWMGMWDFILALLKWKCTGEWAAREAGSPQKGLSLDSLVHHEMFTGYRLQIANPPLLLLSGFYSLFLRFHKLQCNPYFVRMQIRPHLSMDTVWQVIGPLPHTC